MKLNVKSILILALSLLLPISLAGCANTANTAKSAGKLKVVTSIYPVYEFTKQVGGDKVDVSMLVPQGAEPHDWEPTATQLIQIKSAKLFLYHGAGMENLDKILNQDTLGTAKAVAVSQNIQPLNEEHTGENEADHSAGHNHPDAHMWLDPLSAQQEVLNIAQALQAVDPENSDYYKQNAEKYNKELAQLDQEYQRTLNNLPRRDIITSHAAFSYLTKRYNLTQVAIMGLAPDSEPTPEKLANIIDFCKKHKVKYIFFETLVSPKLSETVARETGAKLLVLNPLESLTVDETNQGKNYITVMQDNLANLKIALSE
ncbi:MAG: ABC-type metal ion transporter, periplasmic subunit [Firmicutes bacterium]|nr:ABC-type metal ion transporter, periplasmic subunit [Bacillota bacterium]